MSGSTDLDYLLREARPVLDPEKYVFVCQPATYGDHADWQPIASFAEREGLTLVLRQEVADAQTLSYDGVFQKITLQVHSSLSAVGLTAKFSGRLAANTISANVISGFYHDHIFVALADAEKALAVLSRLAES
ncbi:MAG: ACT domain-containing protein [Gammaproteobacteria bacterium]